MKRIEVRVQPRASRVKVVETGPASFKVYVTCPPVDGKANEAVEKALSDHWNISRSRIRILRGETSRNKIIEICD